MGMIGHFIAYDETTLEQLITAQIQLESLQPWEHVEVDIDKTWHAIHFTLTNCLGNGAAPLGYVVPLLNHQQLPLESYGAFYVTSAQTKEVAATLQSFNDIQLREHYNMSALVNNNIYPLFAEENAEDFFAYMVEHFMALRTFIIQTAQQQKGYVFYVC